MEAGTHSACVTEFGEFKIWGRTALGHFLTPTEIPMLNERAIDVSIGHEFGAVLDGNGTVWAWGENGRGQIGANDTSAHEGL